MSDMQMPEANVLHSPPAYGELTPCDAATIQQRVRDAGVVGAGGAGFPTAVKLQAQAEIFLVNAAECEPMLKV
ncbi:electron transport complex protein RnfC, partial [Yersinia enterocolitica]